ncbi:MAG TPA: hypothetical protein VF815_45505 [Myxococcaceae bacterium]|jgi:hypothetical protein
MIRSYTRVAGPYRVTFSPEAWKEIGRLSGGTFLALQETLDRIAQQAPSTVPADSGPEEITFKLRGLVIQCERDDTSRTLTVQRLLSVSEGGVGQVG